MTLRGQLKTDGVAGAVATGSDLPFYIHGWPGSHAELGLAGNGLDFTPWSRRAAEARTGVCDIVAFSLGAFTALQYAAEHPGRIRRLTLVSPAGPLELGDFLPSMAGGPLFRLAQTRPRAFATLSLAQCAAAQIAPTRILAAMFKTSCARERALLDDRPSRKILVAGLRSSLTENRAHYVERVAEYVRPWADMLHSVRAEVTVIHGEKDVWTPPTMVQALVDALPDRPTVHALPDRGHYGALIDYLSGAVLSAAPDNQRA